MVTSCEWFNKIKADEYQNMGESYSTTEMC